MFTLIVSVAALGLIIYVILIYEQRLRIVREKSGRSNALEKARVVRAEKKEGRKSQIVAFLQRRTPAPIESIRSHLKVSESTASRYMQELVDEHRVALSHINGLTHYVIAKARRPKKT